MPDRPALYELLRNDAVIAHFAGTRPTCQNAREVVFRAYEPAVDATRPTIRLPEREREATLPDGRRQRYFRWTVWTEHARFASTEEWAEAKRQQIAEYSDAWDQARAAGMANDMASMNEQRSRLGEVFFFPGGPGIGLMGIIDEVGLESFSYYLADAPGIVDELMEINTREALAWIAHLPVDAGIEAVFCGDDIAFKSGPLLSPRWLREHYFHRFSRICAAYHARGIRVLFHSDGNLNPILNDLVDSGIDGLNPLEVLANMDAGAVHQRHPALFMAGGIDTAQLLARGSPREVRDAVRRALDQSEGRLMVGSSSELHDGVPLENFLAMREAVLTYS
jgi:hypothetical protein